MKSVTANTPKTSKSVPKRRTNSRVRPTGVDLSVTEKEILLKACKKYRYSIPNYLESRQLEITIIDAIMEKLS